MTAVAVCAKKPFTRDEADDALFRAAVERVMRGNRKRLERTAYPCQQCVAWHLSSLACADSAVVTVESETLSWPVDRWCDGCGRTIPAGEAFTRHAFELGANAALLDQCADCPNRYQGTGVAS